MGELDDYGDQYDVETFVRRVTSVADPILRRRQVQRHVTTVEAAVVASHFQTLIVRHVRGEDERSSEMLIAIIDFVGTADAAEQTALDAVDLAARTDAHLGVAWLLLDPPPARSVERLPQGRTEARPLTLGERRSVASGWDKGRIEPLLRDNHPMVIDRLCANPRVQEPHILAVVTRRPTSPELIATVARHSRWLSRVQIREAIAHNPYSPTGLALRMLPTLPVDLLHRIRHAGELHNAVRMAASYLIALRGSDAAGPSPDELHHLDS